MPIDYSKYITESNEDLKGLSAEDRSLSDSSAIEDINASIDNSTNYISAEDYLTLLDDKRKKDKEARSLNWKQGFKDYFAQGFTSGFENADVSTKTVDKWQQDKLSKIATEDLAHMREFESAANSIDENSIDGYQISEFENHLNEVSPYYRRYKDDKINLNTRELEALRLAYIEELNKEGNTQYDADKFLDNWMQNIASYNQSPLEKYGHAFAGIGTSGVSAIAGFLGAMAYANPDMALIEYNKLKESGELPNNVNFGQFYVNRMMDNPITRWGEAVNRTGYLFKRNQEEAEALYGDAASRFAILETLAEQDEIFDVNLIPKAIQSHGFTLATMALSSGLSAGAGAIGRGVRAASYVNNVRKATTTLEKIDQARKAIELGRKTSNAINRFVIPSLTATGEAVIEGLGTKLNILKTGEQYADAALKELTDYYNQNVELFALSLMEDAEANGTELSEEEALAIAKDHYSNVGYTIDNAYNDIMKHVDAVAMQQGTNVFLLNQTINGIIANSFKAGLQAPAVKKSLAKGKEIISPNPIRVSKTGKVDVADTPIADLFGYIEEPFGEALEETLQSLASSTTEGVAEYSISKFTTQYLKNKYNGDAMYIAGEHIAGEWTEAMNTLKASAVSKETVESALMGAIGSMVGLPNLKGSNYVSKYRGDDGKIHRKLDLGRREGETGFEHFQRLAPWRSGISANIREQKEAKQRLQEEAELIQNWVNDLGNKDKFINAASTLSWSRQLDDNALAGDEFGYRNTVLGKIINDALILDKIKHTEFYKDIVENMQTLASTKYDENNADIKEAVEAIKQDKDSGYDFSGMSDEEIYNRIKDNAQKYLDTIEAISEESDSLSELVGYLDDDTKQSLIYDKLKAEDLRRRHKKLNEEVTPELSKVKDSLHLSSGLNAEQKRAYVYKQRHLDDLSLIDTIKTNIKDLEDKIADLNKKASLNKTEKQNLSDYKDRVKASRKYLKELNKKLAKESIDLEEIENALLTESEILALPAEERSHILNSKNMNQFSKEQQEVIKNIQAALGPETYRKLLDIGRQEAAIRESEVRYIDILHDHRNFSKEALRAKREAEKVAVKHNIDRLNSLTEAQYDEYAKELSSIISNSSYEVINLYNKYLDKNNNYKTYTNRSMLYSNLHDRLNQQLRNKTISENKAKLINHVLNYLSDKGVDMDNWDAIYNALVEQDESGEYKIFTYINNTESSLDESDKTTVVSINNTIDSIREHLDAYNKNLEAVKKTHDMPTIEAKAKSVIIPKAEDDSEQGNNDESTVKAVSNYIEENSIDESEEGTDEKSDSNEVRDFLNRLETELQSLGLTNNAIQKYLNKFKDLLVDKSLNEAYTLFKSDSTIPKNIKNAIQKVIVLDTKDSNSVDPEGKLDTTSDIRSVNLNKIHKDSDLHSFIFYHEVESYLEKNRSRIKNDGVPIHFVAIGSISSKYKAQKGESFNAKEDITIAMVVEDPNGKLEIDNVKYQVIGIVPRSSNTINRSRSIAISKLSSLRNTLVEGDAGNSIADRLTEDSNLLLPISATLKDYNVDKPTGPAVEGTNSVKTLFGKFDKFLNSIKHIRKTDKLGDTIEDRLVITIPSKNGEIESTVTVKPIEDTKLPSLGGRTLVETLQDTNAVNLSVLTANSKLKGFTYCISKALQHLHTAITSEDSSNKKGEINKAKDFLDKIREKYIYFGSKATRFEIEETGNSFVIKGGVGSNLITFATISKNSVGSEEAVISNQKGIAYNILKNIILDSTNSIRKSAEGFGYAKWQVDYKEINTINEYNGITNELTDQAKTARSIMQDTFEDDILEVNASNYPNQTYLEFDINSDTNKVAQSTSTVISQPSSNDVVITTETIKSEDSKAEETPSTEQKQQSEETKTVTTVQTVDPEFGVLGEKKEGEAANADQKEKLWFEEDDPDGIYDFSGIGFQPPIIPPSPDQTPKVLEEIKKDCFGE